MGVCLCGLYLIHQQSEPITSHACLKKLGCTLRAVWMFKSSNLHLNWPLRSDKNIMIKYTNSCYSICTI